MFNDEIVNFTVSVFYDDDDVSNSDYPNNDSTDTGKSKISI